RAANNGISALINPIGQTTARLGLNKRGILDVKLPKNLTVDTLYTRIGGQMIQAFMLIILCILTALKFRRQKH
ncbi:MAG: apolipoprotein N-acyltransferase, partial [Alphaproteobacteria bacterium]|nr:apolipoprotein N-acyltransferase [Alphaproteobacteria bacterium]